MDYRTFARTGIKVSEISLGAEHIEKAPYDEVKRIVDIALDAGVNYTDLFMGSPDIRDHFGRALKGRREKMMIAGHLGAAWVDNQYHRTRDMDMIRDFFWDLLARLGTDYIDVSMLHYIDDMDDLEVCLNGGMLDFALELKKKGIARMIGISTHVPKVASAAIEIGHMDAVMFSVNPLFDLMPEDEGIVELFGHREKIETLVSQNNPRHSLYAQCQKEGVGIIVMKAFAGGMLLGEKSPIKMTVNQCINYALSQPGVVTASLGCQKAEEFSQSLKYNDASGKEKDFAEIYKKSLVWSDDTKCVYCNHCLPCPQGIDIAESMRMLDAGGAPPDNCISCGVCEERCPFGIPVASIFNG